MQALVAAKVVEAKLNKEILLILSAT